MHPRETVDTALKLSLRGLSDHEIARKLDLPIRTIQNWRKGTRRSSARPSAYVSANHCPQCGPGTFDLPAYAHLLGLYLGDGHITCSAKEVYSLGLFCGNEWPGLIQEAEDTLRTVMPTSSVCRVARIGCTEVKSYAKHWPCLFPQHGPGMKHTRHIALELWQQDIVNEYAGRFLRGLFHSDGCRVTNNVRRVRNNRVDRYAYPRYFFNNESTDILGLCGEALDRLGIAWRYTRPNCISVARRDAVAVLDEFVGPKY